MRDMGVVIPELTLKTDASAAKGVAMMRGVGKVRQLEVSQLWLQEKVARKEVKVVKVKGTENLADAGTKYVDRAGIDMTLKKASIVK